MLSVGLCGKPLKLSIGGWFNSERLFSDRTVIETCTVHNNFKPKKAKAKRLPWVWGQCQVCNKSQASLGYGINHSHRKHGGGGAGMEREREEERVRP